MHVVVGTAELEEAGDAQPGGERRQAELRLAG